MKDLTQGSEGRGILRFAAPMLLGHMFQQLYTFVDQIIVGRYLGKEALASVGASFPILFTLIALIIGIPAGWGFGMVLSMIYFNTGRWKTKSVIKVKVEPATVTR